MRADEVTPVAAAVVRALVDSGVRLTSRQADSFRWVLTNELWPLLGAEDQAVLVAQGREHAIASGRAIPVSDEEGRQSYWRGGDDQGGADVSG